MDTLLSARKSIWAPISYDFRKFFISVWSRQYLSVHRRLPCDVWKEEIRYCHGGAALWNRKGLAPSWTSLFGTGPLTWGVSALFETPEHWLKVAPSQKAHLTADSARLGANPVTNVTHFRALPSLGCKRIILLFRPLTIQDFPDWILASRSRACIESNVCLREIPTLENFLEEKLYRIGYLIGQLPCFSLSDCFEFPISEAHCTIVSLSYQSYFRRGP